MKVKNHSCFRINCKPEIIPLSLNLDVGFIKMPLVRVSKINLIVVTISNNLKKGWSKAFTPLRDCNVRNFNLVGKIKGFSNFSKG